jgi:hypothetical protein
VVPGDTDTSALGGAFSAPPFSPFDPEESHPKNTRDAARKSATGRTDLERNGIDKKTQFLRKTKKWFRCTIPRSL